MLHDLDEVIMSLEVAVPAAVPPGRSTPAAIASPTAETADACLVYDLDGTIYDASDAACALLGYAREQLLGASMTMLRPGIPLATLKQGWAAVVAQGSAQTPVLWIGSDGRQMPLTVTARLVQHEPVRIQVIAHDPADEQRQQLLQSRRYLLQLMDSLRECVLVVDPKSQRLLDVNQATVALTGYSKTELLSMFISDLRVPEERAAVATAMTAAQAQDTPGEPYQVTWLCRDGRRLPLEVVTCRTVLGGEPVLIGTARDISDRLHAETAAQLAEAQYRRIFESAREAIFRTTGQSRFEAANPATAALLGYASPAQLVLEVAALRDLFVEGRRYADLQAMLDATYAVDDFAVELRRRDGTTCWVSLRIHLNEPGNRRAGLQGTAIDITARRLADTFRYQALHDPLTGLANRALLLEQLEQMLDFARTERRPLAVLALDLDDFKAVNDTHGHAIGDALLRVVAARLQETVR